MRMFRHGEETRLFSLAPLAVYECDFCSQKTAKGSKNHKDEIQRLILHDNNKLLSTCYFVDIY
jgi:hypothetical protein